MKIPGRGVVKKLGHTGRTVLQRVSASKFSGGVAVLAFAAVGTMLLTSSHAATQTAAYEAENGTVTSPASVVADSGASGGQMNTKAKREKLAKPGKAFLEPVHNLSSWAKLSSFESKSACGEEA